MKTYQGFWKWAFPSKIVVGMLHGPVLLFRINLLVPQSRVLTWGSEKKKFATFWKVFAEGLFGVLDFLFKIRPVLTKIVLSVYSRFLFLTLFLCNFKAFFDVLAFTSKITIDFLSSSRFFQFRYCTISSFLEVIFGCI